ncbi:MAG: hypothetical protein A2286_13835 [Gammaproteobacteria bacterium RIFOXYA12_FULL_61_12]|nr:MAG: hypothetical protein A2514_15290 [Gammaproteobacteria bacterium RIFOXYD12_FULL_61_37]OGT90642.1 MAG: hypothetical protein A2286_13835 [Gammaproteobacteria bacterium RIFOXYA12_FULL_61_12]
MNRYHIQRGTARTTVTLDSTICELLALKMGKSPDTQDSHAVVRQWLQAVTDSEDDHERDNFSQWLKMKAILYIADDGLITKHRQWQDHIDKSWNEELTRRVNEADSGKVRMIPKDDVFKAAREQLA